MNGAYLPIGSVVLLRGGAKKVMVIGYFGEDETGYQVDYMGVPYPEGILDPSKIIGFNRPEIQEIVFEGYKSAEQTSLFTQLDGYASGLQFNQSPTVPIARQSVQQQVQPQQSQQNNNNNQQF